MVFSRREASTGGASRGPRKIKWPGACCWRDRDIVLPKNDTGRSHRIGTPSSTFPGDERELRSRRAMPVSLASK